MRHKQEETLPSTHRYQTNTARPQLKNSQKRLVDGYAFGYNPYATVHLRRPQHLQNERQEQKRSRLKDIANTPFKRISRVEQMIQMQKNLLIDDDEEDIRHNHSLRPHFKVRTSKQPLKHHQAVSNIPEDTTTVHLQNLSLECPVQTFNFPFSPPYQESPSGNSFVEIFKNRRRLNRKSPKKKVDASLLDMLNRISDGIPLQRYKSKAFDNSSKVYVFLPPSI